MSLRDSQKFEAMGFVFCRHTSGFIRRLSHLADHQSSNPKCFARLSAEMDSRVLLELNAQSFVSDIDEP